MYKQAIAGEDFSVFDIGQFVHFGPDGRVYKSRPEPRTDDCHACTELNPRQCHDCRRCHVCCRCCPGEAA